jgi:hypothetical protein
MKRDKMLMAEVVLLVLGLAGIVTACSPLGRAHPERFLLGAAVLCVAALLSSSSSGVRGWRRRRLRLCLLLSELCGAGLALFMQSAIITF